MKKTIIALLLVVATFFSTAGIAGCAVFDPFAPVKPMYETAKNVRTTLSISTSGKATCYACASIDSQYSCVLTLELQKKESSGWATKKTWTANDNGAGFAYIDETRYVTRGDYRLQATVKISNSYGRYVETVVAYSSIVSY